VIGKPRLILPGLKPSSKLTAPPKPSAPEQQPYGELLRQIIVEEFARHNDRNATFAATMARITADDATFRRFAIPVLQALCRKRIKRYTQALHAAGLKQTGKEKP
jgi:hypothetical protein